ncbi:uncharacterized protein LOC114951052 [Acropora millepora]|uniref:uncharacterized protein LOC114951052 n=1 Tax=Acropora millepora TaxID=45264 RepID=UPI001CF4E440|nr:uncharacterized protein LOC114951052 [Acropora millepora]
MKCVSDPSYLLFCFNDEQRRLNLIMQKLPSTKEPLQRSHSPSYDAEVEQHRDLSHILSRLDRVESKLDSILRESCTPASSRSETPIPVFIKEVSLQPVKGLMG